MTINLPQILEKISAKISKKHNNDILLLTSSQDEAVRFSEYLSFFFPEEKIITLPSLDNLPYDRVSPSKKIIAERARSIGLIASSQRSNAIIISPGVNILTKYPSKKDIGDFVLVIRVGETLSQKKLETFLVENNYEKNSVAIDPGDYSSKGYIIDLVTFDGEGYRINFEWDKIISIKKYDTQTQISYANVDSLEIYMASCLRLNQTTVENFRNAYLKNFGIGKMNEPIFEKISSFVRPDGAENFAPVFYEESVSIFSLLKEPEIFLLSHARAAIARFREDIEDFYKARIDSVNFYPAFAVKDLFFEPSHFADLISPAGDLSHKISIEEEEEVASSASSGGFFQQSLQLEGKPPIGLFCDFAHENRDKYIVICASFVNSERIKSQLKEQNQDYIHISNIKEAQRGIINISSLLIQRGFVNKEYAIVPDVEILGPKKQSSPASAKKLKNILKEYDNFCEKDLVVHMDHGIGMYDGIEQIEVENIRHDCLKIIYNKGDKLFIPVENAYCVKKYGEGSPELDSLGSASWQRRKAKLKSKIGEIAITLMDIAAKRSLATLADDEYDMEAYHKFCDKFPYVPTEDQERAFGDILDDIAKGKPMDRLVCGDVGFGKTEVAMRASFLISQKKQVAVIVPTTILAKQHYANFLERFRGFDTKIGHISRFVSSKNAEKIKEEVKNGNIDIIIGTHAILADSFEFENLGLVVIDEEQHFGVLQKEKLKKLKNSVHTLTLSATPIPRTLQISLVGLKDLSIISTPPIDRLSVKTNLIEFDDVVIRDALLREKFRGGKSFFVCPRVADLNEMEDILKNLVPELSVKVAHGKLAPSTIDKIMEEFYDGKFDILISTAIVESGLDVPSANTMFIYKAEMFGLSQLYQLRGRVGRAKLRGYAYLVHDRKKLPTKSAIKRLEIMQSIDSLGAGFTIACHDMDIRGFGNMIGDDQSGHIKEVGVELYHEMLEEAINRIKDSDYKEQEQKPEVKIKVPVYIPDEYIGDSSLRLSIYRRAGSITTEDEINQFCDELLDRFGTPPESVKNLTEIVRLRIACENLRISSLDAAHGGFVLKFREDANHEAIIKFVSSNPKNTKIKPDNKLVVIKKLQESNIILEAKQLLSSLSQLFFCNKVDAI
ncbi:MAG: transcription-repair coupling factor [Rickettsiaceae bacterium]|nr:transcription-repair coupling factor [Rickettsiaceae bacterium]